MAALNAFRTVRFVPGTPGIPANMPVQIVAVVKKGKKKDRFGTWLTFTADDRVKVSFEQKEFWLYGDDIANYA